MKCLAAVFGALLASAATAAPVSPDARMNAYFAIWANNAHITPEAVERLYARTVLYYGKRMTAAEVYRDKLAFVRRWPSRVYRVVPGTARKTCEPERGWCRVTAVLAWRRGDAGRSAGGRGTTTIVLDLVPEDGTLKIARESGTPLAEADCRSRRASWVCSPYR